MKKKKMNAVFSAALAVCLAAGSTPAMAAGTLSEQESLATVNEHADISQYAATQGMVLLENNGVLPISAEKGTKIALFGAGSYGTVPGGSGSGHVYVAPGIESKVMDGFLNAQYDIVNETSLNVLREEYQIGYDTWTGFGKYVHIEPVYEETEYLKQDIESSAKETDTAVFVIARTSGEGADRTVEKGDYYLSDIEYKNLSYVAEKFENVIVVLNVAEVIDTNFFNGKGNYPANDENNRGKIEGLDALLLMSQAGEKEGDAVVQVLNGSINPSGKLTDTWAVNYEDYPASDVISSRDDNTLEEFYVEDIFVGYRYFDTFGVTPAYPFGYGLSYTNFDIQVTSVLADAETVKVNAAVKNTGSVTGKEVVEVYFSAPEGKIAKPYQELAGYQKVEVEPGDLKNISVTFDTTDFSSYDESKNAYVIEAGDYTIRVGNSSRNTAVAATITVNADAVIEECTNALGLTAESMKAGSYDPMYVYEDEAIKVDLLGADSEGYGTGIVPTENGISASPAKLSVNAADFKKESHNYTEGDVITYVSSNDKSTDSYQYAEAYHENDVPKVYGVGKETIKEVETSSEYTLLDVVNEKISMEQLIASMSYVELADLVMGDSFAEGESNDAHGYESIIGDQADFAFSAAGLTTNNLYTSRLIPQISLSDGPAGVRIPTDYLSCTPIGENEEYDPNTVYYYYHPYASSQNMAYYYEAEDITGKEDFDRIKAEGTKIYVEEGTRYQYCSAIPVGTCLAQTFDPEIIEACGRLIASEMKKYGVSIWLAPGMNIHRDPLCGRNFEYYSEDPTVVAITGIAETNGIQTLEDGSASGVGVTIKHFAANNQENSRFGSNSVLSERAAREIYLSGFQKVIKNADPWCIMSSYNTINGISTVEHYGLLTTILRDEWNFQGFVMSDWYSYMGVRPESVYGANHGGNTAQAVQLFAGNDVEFPGRHEAALLKTIRSGVAEQTNELRLGDLQKAAANLLNVFSKTAIFKDMSEKLAAAVPSIAADSIEKALKEAEAAKRAAEAALAEAEKNAQAAEAAFAEAEKNAQAAETAKSEAEAAKNEAEAILAEAAQKVKEAEAILAATENNKKEIEQMLSNTQKSETQQPFLTVNTKTRKVKVGKKVTISASGSGTITFKSTKPKVASVTKKGVVKGKKKGTTTIKVTCGGITKKIKVKVTK